MKVQDIRITNVSNEDYEQIHKLCNESFGAGYINQMEFDKWKENPEFFNVAWVDDEFAGYSVMIPAGTREIMKEMDMTLQEVQNITSGKPALIYKSVAVCPQYRKRGLLTKLMTELMDRAEKSGYKTILLSAWMYEDKIPALRSLEKLKFSRLFVRHNLWYQNEMYQCVICKGRCVCDAVIYYKNIGAAMELI